MCWNLTRCSVEINARMKMKGVRLVGIKVVAADRIKKLPPYLFVAIDMKVRELKAKGVDVIDLGIGDPDMPTFNHVVDVMKASCAKASNHNYPSSNGTPQLREAIAGWYSRRFGVELDPASEITSLIGSKEGIGHITLAFVNMGDYVLVPSPGYPVYSSSTLFAGGESYCMPLIKKNGFLPDLSAIPAQVAEKAKLMFLNYPNNPTTATATVEFFEEVISFAERHNIIICHDAAYSEMYFSESRPLSFMQIDGAKEVGVEFHSLSKTYNMTGWRLGFAVGNREVLAGLGKIKSNLDSGVFKAIQEAGIAALETDDALLESSRKIYRGRRDVLVKGLREIGLEPVNPDATFYVWIPVPNGQTSAGFAQLMLEECGIVATPGNGFGEDGEGYIRMALTVNEDRLCEAIERMKNFLDKNKGWT